MQPVGNLRRNVALCNIAKITMIWYLLSCLVSDIILRPIQLNHPLFILATAFPMMPCLGIVYFAYTHWILDWGMPNRQKDRMRRRAQTHA
jgi:hypothetical protein